MNISKLFVSVVKAVSLCNGALLFILNCRTRHAEVYGKHQERRTIVVSISEEHAFCLPERKRVLKLTRGAMGYCAIVVSILP